MSDFEKFKKIDEEEIFKKTYIAPKILRSLKEEKFESLCSKSRTMGFISILERELHLDLSELRQKALDYFAQHPDEQCDFEINEQVQKRKKRPFVKFLLFLLLVAGAYAIYNTIQNKDEIKDLFIQNFFASSSSSSVQQSSSFIVAKDEIGQSSIDSSSEQNMSSKQSSSTNSSSEEMAVSSEQEQNSSQEQNQTTVLVQEQNLSSSSSSKSALPQITITPKQKVWVGIIYLDNYKKEQKITSLPIELNSSRDQLIVTGHGKLQISIDGQIKDFDTVKKQRFIYKDGSLEVIDKKSFKQYNKGRDW